MAWYDASWGYRVKITVDNTKVPSTQTDIPVYVDLSALPAGFHTNVKAAGADIRVTRTDETTEVAREVVFYDAATDTGELHFLANSLSGSADTDFYIYYGNAAASEPAVGATYGRNAAWSNSYTAVWHLGEAVNNSAGGYVDSTGNGNSGTGSSMALPASAGKMGDSQDFDGSSDYIDCNSNVGSFTLASTFTLQAWVNPALLSSDDAIYGNTWSSAGYLLRVTSGNKFRILLVTSGGTYKGFDSSVLSSGWRMVHANWDGSSSVNLYNNGALNNETSIAAGTLTTISSANNTNIGRTGDGGEYAPYDGLIDEVRVSSVVRSANWITTEYNNQNSPATFYTLGSQEAAPAGSTARTQATRTQASGRTQAGARTQATRTQV